MGIFFTGKVMFGRSPKKVITLIALLSAVVVMLFSTHAQRHGIVILQGLAFSVMYVLATRQERSLALLSVLTFIILCIFIREPIQSTENIRVVLFSLALVAFSSDKRKIAPALTLYLCWFLYLSLHLLPINLFLEIVSGLFPIASSKTIELMLYEIIGISFIEIVSTGAAKKSESKSSSLFGYQANLLTFAISLNCLILFYFTKNSILPNNSIELRSLANPSSAIMLTLLSGLFIITLLSRKFSAIFENLFAHLELCATPDSGFLTLTRKPALLITEFVAYSKSIRKKSEALTSSRKKATELKVELNALKRQIQEMAEKQKDLSIMADSINIGLLAITNDGTITYVNRLFYEILELETSQAEMLHFTDLINKNSEACDNVLKAIESALENGKSFKIKSNDLSIEVVEWTHQEQTSKKSSNSMIVGNKRILVFLKKLESSSKTNLISTSEC